MFRLSFGTLTGQDWLTIIGIIAGVIILLKGISTPAPGTGGGKNNNGGNNNNNINNSTTNNNNNNNNTQ